MQLSYLESKIFGKVCYGFKRNKNGIVEIVPDKAKIVQQIFSLYLAGNSLESIQGFCLKTAFLLHRESKNGVVMF